tara:strand:+ start:303 stop:524 length:222 start_codon:yes stop_codon:yes gene_type:complete
MEQKSSVNKDLWFVCDKCGTEYDEFLEEIIPAEQIKGSIEWAYSPTSNKNKWDALEKSRIRGEYEAKKRKSEG